MSNPLIDKRTYWILKDVKKAIREFDMIQDGDKIAVGVSGGKDSLSLLALLDEWQKSAPHKIELFAVCVMGDSNGPSTQPHQPLEEWLSQKGYKYSFVPMYTPEDEPLPMNCQRCAWNRKRTIFEEADRLGCNVIALGHHADDLAQTTLLNILYHGRVETIPPSSNYFNDRFKLIRPLCYIPEKELKSLASLNQYPPPPPECPRSKTSKRYHIAKLIDDFEKECKDIRINLLNTGLQNR